MPDEYLELQALANRITILERENKRLKHLYLISSLAVSSILLMGQAAPRPRTIEANEILIKDGAGTLRAKLAAEGKDEGLALYDAHGVPTTFLGPGMVTLFEKERKTGTVLTGTQLYFIDTSNSGGLDNSTISYLNADGLGLHKVKGRMLVGMQADQQGGAVFVSDAKGFEAVLGRQPLQNLTTGSVETPSAASLILFDQRRHVIWRVP